MKKLQVMVILLVTVVLVSTLSIPAVAQPVEPKEDSDLPAEVKIGGVFPIAKRPDAGRDRRDAFLMAVSEINNQSGPDRVLPEGVRLVPIVKDDDNSAAGGTAAAQALIAEGVHIVIGSSGSSVSAAMAAELGPQKIPQISYASSSPSLSDRSLYPYFMRVAASDADQGRAVADLVQAFGWTRVATIHTSDSYGTGLITVFTEIFEDRGGMIITDQEFDPGATDVSAQVQAIMDAGPEVVIGHFIDVDAAAVVKKAWGLGAMELPGGTWIATDGWSTTATFAHDTTVKKAMQEIVGTTPVPLKGEGYQSFNQSWFDPQWNYLEGPAYSQSSLKAFNAYAPLSYDAVFVAAKGLAAADTVDGETLLDALYGVTHDGASGFIEFNELGEVVGRYQYVQLNDETYTTFGEWQDVATLESGNISMQDGSVWTITDNKAVCEEKVRVRSESTPGFVGPELLVALCLVCIVTLTTRHRRKS